MGAVEILNNVLLWVLVLLNMIITLALVQRVNKLNSMQAGNAVEEQPPLKAGEPAPEFEARTLNGEKVTLSDFLGKVTMFIFISSQCPVCGEKVVYVNSLLAKQNLSFKPTFVCVDDMETARSFIRKLEVDVPVIVAPESSNPFKNDYNIIGTPSYCTIDENGKVKSSGFGANEELLSLMAAK